jgi:hypothetical protein
MSRQIISLFYYSSINFCKILKLPPWRDSISRPMAPQAKAIPLDHAAGASTYVPLNMYDKPSS